MEGIFFAIASAILIGWSLVIGTVATQNISPVLFVAVLYGFSVLAIGGYAILSRSPIRFRNAFHHRKEFLLLFLTRGILGVLFFMWGISLTIGIRAAFLPLVEPMLVYTFSVLRKKETLTTIAIISLFVLLGGSYLFISNGESLFTSFAIGDFILLLGIAFYALSYLPAQNISQDVGPLSTMLLIDILSGILFVALSIPFYGQLTLLTSDHWRLILAFLITGPTLGVGLWYLAIRTVRPWILASLLTLQVLSAATLAYVWLGQTLQPIQWVGGGLMVIAAFIITRRAASHEIAKVRREDGPLSRTVRR